jgi:hypothetical protein
VNEDAMRDEEPTDPTPERSDTTTAVDDAFTKVPEADSSRPTDDGTKAPAADGATQSDPEALLDRDRSESFRRRWDEIQAGFVDRPRHAVEGADRLVLEVVQQLQASFTLARERLEAQWGQGDDASTEDLRQALRRYRSFFDRLLSA